MIISIMIAAAPFILITLAHTIHDRTKKNVKMHEARDNERIDRNGIPDKRPKRRPKKSKGLQQERSRDDNPDNGG